MKISASLPQVLQSRPRPQPEVRSLREGLDVVSLSADAPNAPPPSSTFLGMQISADLVPGPLGAALKGVVYHGSAQKFAAVEPRPSTRLDASGAVRWQGTAMFATTDYRISLLHTNNRCEDYSVGADSIHPTSADQPLTYSLAGGKNLPEALDHLFGKSGENSQDGFIYLLDQASFGSEPGLGAMEVVSRAPEANLARVDLNRRQEIDRLVEAGKVVLDWRPAV